VVSLHTIHHLPEDEHLQAYSELHRVLAPGSSAVVVNGWPSAALMKRFEPLVRFSLRVRSLFQRLAGKSDPRSEGENAPAKKKKKRPENGSPKGTFTSRHDVAWMRSEVGSRMPLEILAWRSASVRFLRNLIFPWLGGRYWLRLLYHLEERSPQHYGEIGQYPLIVIQKMSKEESTEA
jgi:SAM-dependent methyltransferase